MESTCETRAANISVGSNQSTPAFQRNSSIELARIVSMLAIVIYHFIYHGILNNNVSELSNVNDRILALSAFPLMFGTNVFILISGYYRIKLKLKSIIGLWLLCTFYNLLSVAINGPHSLSAFIHSFFISCTPQWYFQSYLWLLILSPILNKAFDALSTKENVLLICLWFGLTCISGWFFGNTNRDGHNIMQMFFMYYVGMLISKGHLKPVFQANNFVLLFFISSILGVLFARFYPILGMRTIYYHNNPFTVVSSIAVFSLFESHHFHNITINIIALSMPSALLLSDVVLSGFLYQQVHDSYQNSSILVFTLFFPINILLLFVLSFGIDYLRRVATTPISKHLERMISKCLDWFSVKVGYVEQYFGSDLH